MKVQLLTLFLLLSFSIAQKTQAQIVSDSLLANFYNTTIFNFYNDSIVRKRESNWKTYILKTEFDSLFLIKKINGKRINYYNDQIPFEQVLDSPVVSNHHRFMAWMNHQFKGADTVELHIGLRTIFADGKDCRMENPNMGLFDYLPTARFIYNKQENKWQYLSFAVMREAELQLLRKQH
jgi:hypothetical protein